MSRKLDGYVVGGSFEVTDRIFIYGNYGQVDTGFDGLNVNSTSYGIGAQWYFTQSVAVTASGSFSDDGTAYTIGLRGTWGR